MIIYSKSSGINNAAIGRLETPIKMIIENQSDILSKQDGICSMLFNIEKSNRFGETIVGQNEFDVFHAVAEGGGAENDTISETFRNFIEHIQYMKEFHITAEMMEDANFGVAADAKRRAENFTRAYYKTINKICEFALINGRSQSATYAGAALNLKTGDDRPLFSASHKWGFGEGNTQSNIFGGDIFTKEINGTRVMDSAIFEEALSKLSIKMRNMKDENGEPLGYTPDTIIIPGNRPALETTVKKVCGSEGTLGSPNNDINLHYNQWNIVILPGWQTEENKIMLMSSEANKNLSGNMFFNRVPLTISSWVDHHTGNYIWNGRCRFGVGFGTYKHILLAVDAGSESGLPEA